ncbi:hypothetical protein HanRHA438_Chr04g0176681 [Helianthus annuus]|nr:hypothetical protein HanRHA438_Chr04g0176681 [Helianthus annuus]
MSLVLFTAELHLMGVPVDDGDDDGTTTIKLLGPDLIWKTKRETRSR